VTDWDSLTRRQQAFLLVCHEARIDGRLTCADVLQIVERRGLENMTAEQFEAYRRRVANMTKDDAPLKAEEWR